MIRCYRAVQKYDRSRELMSAADLNLLFERHCTDVGIAFERVDDSTFIATLKGEQKLAITVAFKMGTYALAVNVFVMRKPDENVELVHRYLLETNLKIFGLSYAVNHLGDIYLTGRLPLTLNEDDLDRLFGAVLRYADESFNKLVELGFESAIRREWAWRESRGESLENLQAFAHMIGE
ncbi:unannotated protein [freshwater metagenome]|uniref:Unannotated protein n=2 Tax=freshwater metagenome TaxID=449393 RepID=A0A6J7GCV6_9ZZZZ